MHEEIDDLIVENVQVKDFDKIPLSAAQQFYSLIS